MSEEERDRKLFAKLDAIEKKVDTLHAGVYGDVNYEGLKKIVDRHAIYLKPLEVINKYPKASMVILFIVAHLAAYASFKGIDKLLTLMP